MPAARAAYQ